MEKTTQKTCFRCQNCAAEYLKWQGQCQDCGEWNCLLEEVKVKKKVSTSLIKSSYLHEISEGLPRHLTKIEELDRVLGGGLMPESYVLLGGEPGIGKSTLLLQMCSLLDLPTLYVSAEESREQIIMRGQRLGLSSNHVEIIAENEIEKITQLALQKKPKLLIIDSIQTVYLTSLTSAAGSVSQVRESSHHLMNLAKKHGITVFVIGHITKEGHLAGPKILEHMVDTVLLFEGDGPYRTLRSLKNRFGPSGELGVFQIESDGLKEVKNASEFFLSERQDTSAISGSSVFCSLEGTRPVLCEIQALTLPSVSQFPRRTSLGYDIQRVHLLAALLEKFLTLPLSNKEIFINVVGGLKISEPSADLSVISSLISSEKSILLPPSCCFLGEVGLTGNVRSVYALQKRIQEALRLGFSEFVVPASQKKLLSKPLNEKPQNFHFIKNIKEIPEILKTLSSQASKQK